MSLFLGCLVLLTYIPMFVLVPYCFDFCSFVMEAEAGELDCTSCFSFLRRLWLAVLHMVVYICQCYVCVYVSQFVPPFPCPHHRLFHMSILYICISVTALQIVLACTIFLDSIYIVTTWYLFFWFTSLCMTDSRSIHITTNGPISVLFLSNIPL